MHHQPIMPQPKITRFRRAVVGLGGAAVLGIMAYAFTWTDAPAAKKPADAPAAAQASKPAPFLAELKEDYTPPPPPEPKREEPAEPAPSEPQAGPKREPQGAPKKEAAIPPAKPSLKKEKPPERWLFADVKKAEPLFQRPKDDKAALAAAQAASAIKPASWVKPDDPRRVLFPDQVIPAITEQAINSDEPGTLRFMVTQNVVDTQGGNHVLIPQFTRGVSVMDGAIREHQERVPFRVKSLRFPDGTFLHFDAQVGDRSGANAIDGKVNRHLGEKGLAILGSALLSIGTRLPFGSTEDYHPNLAQEFAQDVSSGINRAGQQMVSKALTRKNTITQQAGYPVTIQFLEPVSFQQPPRRTAQ